MSLNVVFMGTPEFAVPSLAELVSNGYNVVRVYTQPPRKSGRGQKLTKSPVHQFAELMGLVVETPESFRKPSVIDDLEALNADVACVVAYGQILPQRALEATEFGCLNLHASLLPRWRGAAPVQRAIMSGDKQTGVQIQQMEKGLDTGDILLSETVDILDTDTAASLFERLSHIGAGMWPRCLAALSRGGLSRTPQTGEACYAHKIDKSESRIDWTKTAQDLDCHIRGLAPFPGAWCEINGQRLKIHMASVVNADGKVGEVLDEALLVACGAGALRLTEVQPAGKPKMSAEDYLRGSPLGIGTILS
ncbi:methionyl-tRNA formyltransferase [Litorimonas taeanensis]|uniref:Methionyl-tRNA formyltransferase n=1 Tax=Litorimonas taeanensis TaxID=568099 RepID=A0A420WE30_9PROT|nr:methionyl-tRNA formyltransferase [Litorimonas taeanensis]RKQ69246.1 methionyl-tRNA formyltransferase [Litorimonas taeanensis]